VSVAPDLDDRAAGVAEAEAEAEAAPAATQPGTAPAIAWSAGSGAARTR
jgi:hypothetical protein